jgi:hypothetical protein
LLAAALKALGHPETYQLLSGSLMVDASALGAVDWAPVTGSRQGLAALARGSNRPSRIPREDRALA